LTSLPRASGPNPPKNGAVANQPAGSMPVHSSEYVQALLPGCWTSCKLPLQQAPATPAGASSLPDCTLQGACMLHVKGEAVARLAC
jgi:hypothetical protein